MVTDIVGPVQALKEGCTLLRRFPVLLLGFVLFFCLLLICALANLPYYLNWLLLPVLASPLLGGLHILLMNAARDCNPRLTDLFSGFRHFFKWLGATWAVMAASGLFLSACFLVVLPAALLLDQACVWPCGISSDLHHVLFILPAEILSPVIALALFTRYVFVLFSATDMATAHQSLERSRQLVKGRYLKVLRTIMPVALIPSTLLGMGHLVLSTDANAFGWPGWAGYATGMAMVFLVALCGLASAYSRLYQPSPRMAEEP